MDKRVYYYERDNLKDRVSTARYIFALIFLRDKTVVDIGCGARKGPFIVSKTSKEVVGLDVSTEAVVYSAKAWPEKNIKYVASDAQKLAFKNNLFDAALSFEVIEHIDNYSEYLKEVFRVLKKDGIFIVSTPNRLIASPNGVFSNTDHIREFDLEELKEILKKFFPQVVIYGQSVSQRAKVVEECRKKNLQLISKLPLKFKAIFPAKFKDILLRKYHYLWLKLFKKINEERINEEDFSISLNNLSEARYFVAFCKKSLG